MTVLVVGSLNVDLSVDVHRLPSPGETVLGRGGLRRGPGGKGLNQAVAAARQGAAVAMVGAVGDDADGVWLVDTLEAEGIDASRVRRVGGAATGAALITVDASGANTIAVAPGANATSGSTRPAPSSVAVVLVQLEIPRRVVVDALRAAKASGATTVLNPAPAVVLDDELLDLVDVLVPNEHEVAITGLGRRQTIVTLGASGARWYRSPDDADPAIVPPFAVDAVDSTAAGDAFCGALAAGIALGHPIDVALRRASAAGALTVTRPGAAAALPTAAEVDALLEASYNP